MPKVSVIVPCYNQGEYLADALESVLYQTFTDWECIIVNDGSSDNTEEVANKFCELDKRFKYISQTNQGVSAARNNGIKASSGTYILPLDGDDVIDETYIGKAVQRFNTHPMTTLVYCKAAYFGLKVGEWNLKPYNYESLKRGNYIFSCAMYKRSDYDKTVGYNTNMINGYEDWDFWLSLLNKNSVVYRIDEILFHYRVKEKSRNTEAKKYYRELKIQIRQNHKDLYK